MGAEDDALPSTHRRLPRGRSQSLEPPPVETPALGQCAGRVPGFQGGRAGAPTWHSAASHCSWVGPTPPLNFTKRRSVPSRPSGLFFSCNQGRSPAPCRSDVRPSRRLGSLPRAALTGDRDPHSSPPPLSWARDRLGGARLVGVALLQQPRRHLRVRVARLPAQLTHVVRIQQHNAPARVGGHAVVAAADSGVQGGDAEPWVGNRGAGGCQPSGRWRSWPEPTRSLARRQAGVLAG